MLAKYPSISGRVEERDGGFYCQRSRVPTATTIFTSDVPEARILKPIGLCDFETLNMGRYGFSKNAVD
jgi:hypothetical protein